MMYVVDGERSTNLTLFHLPPSGWADTSACHGQFPMGDSEAMRSASCR